MNEFKEARRRLDAIRAAEEQLRKAKERKCDWDDPLDISLYKGLKRIESRTATVKRLSPSFQCPSCHGTYYSHRSWVIAKDKSAAMCRGCYISWKEDQFKKLERLGKVKFVDAEVFPDVEPRYVISSFQLNKARVAAGISCKGFAKRCGWTYVHQWKLENDAQHTVSRETAERIIEVLEELGIFLNDIL